MKQPLLTRATSYSGVSIVTAIVLLCSCALLSASHRVATPPGNSGSASRTVPAGRGTGEIVRGPRGKSEIALTFDGGAKAECFDDLITALSNAHVHSTFFITGQFTHIHPECAAAITRYAHETGNHTWSHLNLRQEPDTVVRDELIKAERAIIQAAGQDPKPRWRAPYGQRDARILKIASDLGYRSIYWTIDSLDGVEPKKTPQFLIDRITGLSDSDLDGAIILMHVGERSTADALPAIIANLQGRGFRLVTVSELLR